MFRNGLAIWMHAVRAHCCLALLLVAFAHTPGLSRSLTSAYASSGSMYDQIDLAAYTLPNGTLPSLCLYDPTGSDNRSAMQVACDFCHIASSAHLATQGRYEAIFLPASAPDLAHHYQYVDVSRQHVGACGKTGPPSL